jgi:hypothetical protein
MKIVLPIRWGGDDFNIVNRLWLEVLAKHEFNDFNCTTHSLFNHSHNKICSNNFLLLQEYVVTLLSIAAWYYKVKLCVCVCVPVRTMLQGRGSSVPCIPKPGASWKLLAVARYRSLHCQGSTSASDVISSFSPNVGAIALK